MNAIESALSGITDDDELEILCCRVLNAHGYDIVPTGGSGDRGRDAVEGSRVVF